MLIDMELLRRIWAVKAVAERWSAGEGGAGRAAVVAVEEARGWAGSHFPDLYAVLESLEGALVDGVGGGAPEGLADALDAVETAILEPGNPELRATAARAMVALRGGGAEPREEDGVLPPLGALDRLATHLVEMDPTDRGQAIRLAGMLGEVQVEEPLSGPVTELLRKAAALLDPVVTPARVRRQDRARAVEAVSGLVEEAVLAMERAELEAGRVAPMATEGESRPRGGDGGGSEGSSGGTAAEGEDLPEWDPLPEAADPTLILDFVTESLENLEHSEEALLELEGNPRDPEALNVVFRAFHSMKGVAGFLELVRISDLAHQAETLFSRVRDGEIAFSSAVADLALRSVDVLKALLDAVRTGLESGQIHIPRDFGPLLTVLADPGLPERLARGEGAPAPELHLVGEERAAGDGTPTRERSSGSAEGSVRVRTDRLDALVDMVGELVIAQSMIAQDPRVAGDQSGLGRKVDQAAKILRELQDLSTSLRMVPLHPAIRKVSRVVRDLSKKTGKPVNLVTEGEDTEIDRTMVDVLADPLVHMVRNSMDHGIETREERTATGKPEVGTIRIAACQQGGNVVITISDDGRGLNREAIARKARERGLLESDRGMSDAEVFGLIFAPGFSTAETVTEVSGRGVGMDVVKRNVESLRGRVTVDSTPGGGSTFSIQLPLTLAITDGMVVRVGGQRYIIPSVKIVRSVIPEAGDVSTLAGRGEMVRIQGDLLPVLRLHRLWGISGAVEDLTRGLLVVVGHAGRRVALLVDEMVAQQQFVVKPLAGIVARTRGVAGGAIMGTGDVGLILDPDALVEEALTGAAVA